MSVIPDWTLFGPTVVVESVLFDGTRTREELPAAVAVAVLWDNPQNGTTIKQSRIIAPPGVNMRDWEQSV